MELALVPSTGAVNLIDMTIEGTVLGNTQSDSDQATVSGNMLATLGLAIDPLTYNIQRVETLEFTGGRIAITR